jgi:hypothetical protein
MSQTESDWKNISSAEASAFSIELQKSFESHIHKSREALALTGNAEEDNEKIMWLLNEFLEALVGTTVSTYITTTNSSEELESRFMMGAERWFKITREIERKKRG